jgi:uncharacterized MAPEG superfamily protein
MRTGIISPEMIFLLWSAALTLLLAVIAVFAAMLEVGLPQLAGNREGWVELPGWAGRAWRAHRNMLENLVLFAIVVFAAHLTQVSNAATLLGAQLFFFGRLAHAILYLAGIPWLRTLAWLVSVVGIAMIFWQVVA